MWQGQGAVASALHPAERHLDLRVPAVAGIVRHLVGQVLPEAHVLGLAARAQQELVDARDEVAERLVGDGAATHRVAQRLLHGRLGGELLLGRVQRHHLSRERRAGGEDDAGGGGAGSAVGIL